ncbi:uncharacterized protein CBL_01884 [Carabus blaptoides fortunei]
MPDSEAPAEFVEPASSRTSVVDSLSSETESLTLSDYGFDISVSQSPVSSLAESELVIPSYTLSPIVGYEWIRIPLEQNLKQMLIKITDTEDLESVTSLRLRVIASDFSLQRVPVYLPHLTELNLDGSALMSLRDLGCDMIKLKILRVNRTGINSLDGISGFPLLIELHAGFNNIRNVSPCSRLTQIEVLDLKKNIISDVNSVSFLELCPTLKYLTLTENPVSLVDNYYGIVKNFLPDLISLDGIYYNEQDKLIEPDSNSTRTVSRLPIISKRNEDTNKLIIPRNIKRPTTAGAIGCGNKAKEKLLPIRPSTARQATDSDFSNIIDGSHLSLKDIRKLFVPSKLTSGRPMCGNPALALLKKRNNSAWEED